MPRAKPFDVRGAFKGKQAILFEGAGRVEFDKRTRPSERMIGTRQWTTKYELNGKTYGNTFVQRGVLVSERDPKTSKLVPVRWEPIINGVMNDKGKMVTTREGKRIEYHTDATSRLDNGFDSLMRDLRVSGVPQNYIDGLTKLWDSLSDQQKASVFNKYRTNANIITYGSSAINERAGDMFDGMDYYKLLRKLVEKAYLGGF